MLSIDQLRFRYPGERFELALPALAAEANERLAVVGPSGCGKTTLLRLVAGILRADGGTLRVLDHELTRLSDREARAFRIRHIGLVFQEFELLDYLTATDNILLPYRISKALALDAAVHDRVQTLAESTGITPLLETYPRQLSQGERQRVAICRALVTQPRLVLADEPTGSLDPANQERIVDLLNEQCRAAGASLIMVTHNHELLPHFERVIDLPALLSNRPAEPGSDAA